MTATSKAEAYLRDTGTATAYLLSLQAVIFLQKNETFLRSGFYSPKGKNAAHSKII
jgi:hypothetical protein